MEKCFGIYWVYASYTTEQCQNHIRVWYKFQPAVKKNTVKTVESYVQTEHVEFKDLQQVEGNLAIEYYSKIINRFQNIISKRCNCNWFNFCFVNLITILH